MRTGETDLTWLLITGTSQEKALSRRRCRTELSHGLHDLSLLIIADCCCDAIMSPEMIGTRITFASLSSCGLASLWSCNVATLGGD